MPLFVTMDVSFGLLGLRYLQKVADLLGAVFASFIPVSTKAVLSASIAGDTWTWTWTTLTNVRDSDHRIPAHRRSSIHTFVACK